MHAPAPDTSFSHHDQSFIWEQNGFGEVYEDLMTYYTRSLPSLAQNRYAEWNQLYPNVRGHGWTVNCFTYATALKSEGIDSFGPEYFPLIDLTNPEKFTLHISREEAQAKMHRYKDNIEDFTERMKLGGFKTMDDSAGLNIDDYVPIIGMFAKHDYHFIKPHITLSPQGPDFTLAQKFLTSSATDDETAEDFFRKYARTFIDYEHPQVFLSPKNLRGRCIRVDRSGDQISIDLDHSSKAYQL